MDNETIYDGMNRRGVSRRDFLKLCTGIAATLGLWAMSPPNPGFTADPAGPVQRVARALQNKSRLPVIWLEMQDCAGCSEGLTRSQSPTLKDLMLNTISMEYHETLSAAAVAQAEANKKEVIEKYSGHYALVVEGSLPTAADGLYCTIGGYSALDLLHEAAAGAALIIATGNCAAFGGLPRARPDPTGARGVMEILKDKPVVNIPGCPAVPEVLTGTLAHYIVFDQMPELDSLRRPRTYYGTTVHDRCLRRPFYEAGKFARTFDDYGARKGWCLYLLGCKGPTTYNACATIKWDAGMSFPIQSGHPCLGCTEPGFWDAEGFYQGQSAPLDRPNAALVGGAVASGLLLGALVGATSRAGDHKEEE